MITKDLFGSYDRYNLSNGELEVSIITLGATVTSLKYKGQDRAVCYDDPDAALAGHGFLCKAVGRYANRIGGAAFTLNGKRYELPPNENGNQLHGGPNSVDKRIWDVEILEGEAIRFSITMPDGDNGYPGNLTMYVTYSLKGSALRVDFGGETDRTTVFAPTVHPYFTLGGESVLQAKMQVNASGHLEVDSELIPSGVVLPCEGKFDFAELREIRENLDDCFVISSEHACTVEYEGSRMEVWTDFPAIQVYTGAKLPAPYHANQGIAIEPEFYPDSPNHPNFPSTVLNPGDSFAKYVEYRFF